MELQRVLPFRSVRPGCRICGTGWACRFENANATAQVSAANLENLRLSLQATLAVDYFELRGDDEQLDLLNTTISIYQQYLDLTNNRFNGGVAALSDVYLAQTQLYQTQAQATDLGVTRNQFEHAIAVLTGQAPSQLSIASRFPQRAASAAGECRSADAADSAGGRLFATGAAADSGWRAVRATWNGDPILPARSDLLRPRMPTSGWQERLGIRNSHWAPARG